MTNRVPRYDDRDTGGQGGGYVVRGPRMTDAVGGALLRSYGHAPTLPEDMRRLLTRLDRRPYR